MKKILGVLVALAGAGVIVWSGASLLATHTNIYGYHPVYAGLAGITVLVAGLIVRAD